MDKTPDLSKKRLWTRQNIKSLEDIKNHGVFMAKREYIQEQNNTETSPPFIWNFINGLCMLVNQKSRSPQESSFPYGVQ